MAVFWLLKDMVEKRQILLACLSIALIAALCYVLEAAFPRLESSSKTSEHKQSRPRESVQRNVPTAQTNRNSPSHPTDKAAESPESELPKEGLVHFKSEEEYLAFLNNLSSSGLRLLGNSDALRTVRVAFTDLNQITDIDGSDVSPNFPVFIPATPEVGVQSGAQAFGASALESIGVFEDNSTWGKGITVAVIDSGVNQH
ncbi:MAG: hypothetical protein ABGY95_05595, partial [Rubritalea sp.]|uniref:hypothetical protein n=1 Tax=Rubritalea sp. TaxID=2109375 RepID=UPI0032420D68